MNKRKATLVTVIIPTFRRTTTLKRAIESVSCQTYTNIEIIVVDDNIDQKLSNEVKTIVTTFNNPNLILHKNEKNLGGALARNVGIELAHGEYIAFLDDDDWYYPAKIEKQMALIEKSKQIGIVYCWTESRNKYGSVETIYKYCYKGNLVYQAMYDCMAATSQWLCRKKAILDVGMFSNVPCKQDSNLILKMMLAGYQIDYVPEVLSVYDSSGKNRISTQNHKKRIAGEEALRDLCRKNYNRITKREQKMVEYSFFCKSYITLLL